MKDQENSIHVVTRYLDNKESTVSLTINLDIEDWNILQERPEYKDFIQYIESTLL